MKNQLMVINGTELTEKDMFSAIENILIELNDTGNFGKAVHVLNTLDKLDNITGKSKSHLLWGMLEWHKVNKPNENFFDHIESTSSTKSITAQRYVNVWQQIQDENIPKKIHDFPMRDLIPVANMLSQGYEPSKKQWDEIELASNSSEILDVIRQVKGKKPRKSGLKIYLERDGSLNCWKDNKKTYVGFLDLEEALTNPDVAKTIERLISGAQIIRR